MATPKIQPSDPTQPDDIHVNRAQRRAIRLKTVLEIVPLRRSRIYQLINEGSFPAPFRLVKDGHASCWFEHEILEWLEQRATASRGA